jgi:ABC-2 type transport system ATP-binding protein
MNNPVAIRTSGLTKVFDKTAAVSNLDLTIRHGELFGIVGPDGSGKTTLMRLFAGIMLPSAGDARVAGFSIREHPESVKERIGYMSQRFGLYEDLTVLENILFYADLYDVDREERPSRLERLLGFSGLAPFKERLAGALSGGMKQKLGLACALIHTPEVLLLDEPTNGVDPVSRREFWKILYDLLREQVTIVLSTSYLDEAERCTRIGVMHDGKILLEGKPLDVRRSLKITMIEIWVDRVRDAGVIARQVPGVSEVTVYGERLHIALEGESVLEVLKRRLEREGIVVQEHRLILPSLEDVMIASVRGS